MVFLFKFYLPQEELQFDCAELLEVLTRSSDFFLEANSFHYQLSVMFYFLINTVIGVKLAKMSPLIVSLARAAAMKSTLYYFL